MKISLACIAGNAEKYIVRFLDSFQPHFDEVVIVRAIGAQQADNTLRIAQDRGCVVGEYMNRPGLDWPHVDDFAAARNLAFSLASGDWIMWADTDDVMSEDSGKQIRSLIADIGDREVDGVLMRYVVPEDGVVNWRERITRRGASRWVNPVHECLEFKPGSKHVRFEGAEILHASDKRHASRDERNLRILSSIPEAERTVSQKFHVFQSLIALDRNAEAIPKAIEFATLPDAGTNEKYEAFFQLARLAGDQEGKVQMLLQALALDPSRREAYGELGLARLMDDPPAALGWTTAMMGIGMPVSPPWNLRRTYYGRLGVSLHAMSLRANSRPEEAEVLEINHFLDHGAKISLLHATRGRPAKAWHNKNEWLRMADNPDAIEHIFGLDADDQTAVPLMVSRHRISHHNAGPVGAWNTCAETSMGEILVQMSDDFEAFPGWDTAIIQRIGDASKEAVLAVSDGARNDALLCMAILTRARYKRQGYMFHPEFFSMYSDNWFSRQAYKDGVVIDCHDLVFEHKHPAFGKAEVDETYARSNSSIHYSRGKAIFDRLEAGIKTAGDISGWCDYRDLYQVIAHALPEGGVFVEVGSWVGQSIILLAQELQNIGKKATLVCVDTFKGEQNQPSHVQFVEQSGGSIRHIFEANIKAAHVDDMIRIIEGDSAESAALFADNAIDGAFIDADHSYNGCRRDVEAWFPKVKADGIFCGHDYPWHEVKRAVDEHAAANGYQINTLGRCWIKSNPANKP